MKVYGLICAPVAAILAAGLAGAAPAGAADLLTYKAPPPPPPPPTWAGFYFGAQTGAIIGSDTVSTIGGNAIPNTTSPFGGTGGITGIVAGEVDGPDWYQGIYAGYNWQTGNLVYGLEADINSLGPVDSVLGSARARLGYGGDRFLVYGTAGVAFLSVDGGLGGVFVGGNGGNGGNGGPGGDGGNGGNGFGAQVVNLDGTSQAGFVGGVGAEYRLSPAAGLGIEALYYAFGGSDGFTPVPDDFVTVRGRLSFYPGAAAAMAATAPAAWSGLYLGGHIGGFISSNESLSNAATSFGQDGGDGVRGIDGGGGGGGGLAFASLTQNTSVVGGVHLGYNFQYQNFVFGPEADADLGSGDANRYSGTLRARLGWASDSFLIYGTGGIAATRNEATAAIFAGDGGNGGNGGALMLPPGGIGGAGGVAFSYANDQTLTGYVVGGGIEAQLGYGMSAGIEALYYDYESASTPYLALGGGRSVVASGDTSDGFTVRSRLSFILFK